MMSNFSLQFSLHFGEKIFWLDKGENTQVNIQEERKTKKMKQTNVDNCTWVCLRCSTCTWEFLSNKRCPIFLFNFLSILERKLFSRLRKKTPGFHHLFSFLLTQPNILQKKFSFHFLFIVFHSPYFTPNKHTLNVIKNLHFKKC